MKDITLKLGHFTNFKVLLPNVSMEFRSLLLGLVTNSGVKKLMAGDALFTHNRPVTWKRFLSLDDGRKFPDDLMIVLALGQPAVALKGTLDVRSSVFHLDLCETKLNENL